MTHTDSHAAGRPTWVDVMVETTEQREALMAFYSALHGWTWDVGAEEMGYYSIARQDGRAVMGMGQGPGGAGVVVTYFATEDIDASAARATELGGNVFMGPMAISDVGSMALVVDPTGAVHGLWQKDTFGGFEVMHEPGAPGWWDHSSSDPDAAGAYYQALTGHSLTEPEPGMKVLADGDEWFASVSPAMSPDQPAGWNAIYVVDTLERFRHVATKNGATVLLEEMPVPGSAISAVAEPVMNKSITVMRAGEAPA